MDLTVSTDPAISVPVGPLERLGVLVMAFDVSGDFAGKIGLGCKDSAGDKIALDLREPDFDLVEPGGVGGRVVKLDVGMSGEELSHCLGLMGRKVVGNDVDVLSLGLCGNDIGKECNELGTGVALGGFAKDLPAGHFQCGVEGECPMPEVFESVALDPSRRQRQDGIESIKGLDGRLLINAEHRSVSWGSKVKTDDIGSFGFKGGIITGHIVPPPRRLETSLDPHAGDSHMAHAEFSGKFARTPMGGSISGLAMQRPIYDPCLHVFCARSGQLARMASPETRKAFLPKAIPPELHRIDAARLAATRRRKALATRQTKDNSGTANIVGTSALAAADLPQFTPLWRTQSEWCWHEENHTCKPSDVTVTLH